MADWIKIVPPGNDVPLDPKVRTALDLAGPLRPLQEMTPAEARADFDRRNTAVPRLGEPVGAVKDVPIPVSGGKLPVRVYTPVGAGPFPILIYLHGGGWVLGGIDSHDDVCRSLCRRAGCLVVSVDYRLSPEHKHPAALDDAVVALQWFKERGPRFGGDPARIAVAGDSAGGQLAAALALTARDRGGPRIALQVLIYPVTDDNFETASYRRFAADHGLTRAGMMWFWKQYLAGPDDAAKAYAVPMRAADLSGLPPAFVLTAGHDVLRDEGEAYAGRLGAAGVPVKCTRYADMHHGFIRLAGLFPQSNRALDEIAGEIKSALMPS